ncbi:MAG: hypothetical protein F6K39_11710 [Okeania sp. SIO3B3]|nr:hypothetical protein [Okeania sp. SIO3B3]
MSNIIFVHIPIIEEGRRQKGKLLIDSLRYATFCLKPQIILSTPVDRKILGMRLLF